MSLFSLDICKKAVISTICFLHVLILFLPAILVSLVLFIVGSLLNRPMIEMFGFNLLLSLDQFGNTILLGDPDETISSRTGRAIISGRPNLIAKLMHKIIDKLFYVLINERNHCINAVESHKSRYEKELWSWITRV